MPNGQVPNQPAQHAVVEAVKHHVAVFGQRQHGRITAGCGRAYRPVPLAGVAVPVAQPAIKQAGAEQRGLVDALVGAGEYGRKGFLTVDHLPKSCFTGHDGRFFFQVSQLPAEIVQRIRLKSRVVGADIVQLGRGARHPQRGGQRWHHQRRIRVGRRHVIAQHVHQKRAPQQHRRGPNRVLVNRSEHVGAAIGRAQAQAGAVEAAAYLAGLQAAGPGRGQVEHGGGHGSRPAGAVVPAHQSIIKPAVAGVVAAGGHAAHAVGSGRER